MLHIIDSCDDAGASIKDGEEVLCQEYIYNKWPECQALPVFERQAVVSLEVHANAKEGYELMFSK